MTEWHFSTCMPVYCNSTMLRCYVFIISYLLTGTALRPNQRQVALLPSHNVLLHSRLVMRGSLSSSLAGAKQRQLLWGLAKRPGCSAFTRLLSTDPARGSGLQAHIQALSSAASSAPTSGDSTAKTSGLTPIAVVSLSPAAKACLQEAQQQAMSMRSAAVHPGHVLLGCLHLPTSKIGNTGTGTNDSRDEVYPCRRAYQLLLEAGVALQEAGQMVQQGLAQLSLSDTPPGSPAAAPTASAATLGLTQHVIRQACMLAANAGHHQVQPVHLLLSLCDMTPLPTMLHNPISWVVDQSQKSKVPAQHALGKLYSELMTCLQLGYPAGKARFKAANAALLSAVANMSVAEMAQFLGLARAASAVLQPDVRSAVVDQLHKLELLGGHGGSSHRMMAPGEWVQLLEGAEAQGIQIEFEDLRHAIPALRAMQATSELQGSAGGLALAFCRILHRGGRKWKELDNIGTVPWEVDRIMMATDSKRDDRCGSIIQRMESASNQHDWHGVLQAAESLVAVDSVTSAGGRLAAEALQRLRSVDVTNGRDLPLLEAASHICSYLGAPGRQWEASLSFHTSLFEHLPASSSVSIIAAQNRRSVLPSMADGADYPAPAACGPAELVALAEVRIEMKHDPAWLKQKGTQRVMPKRSQSPPYTSAWWRLWKDCVCSMPRAFSPGEASRLMTALAGLHARGQLPKGLIQEPATTVRKAHPSNGSITINQASGMVIASIPSQTEAVLSEEHAISSGKNSSSTSFTLSDAISIMVHMHLGSNDAALKAALVNAATQLMLAAKDPGLSKSLASVLEQDSKSILSTEKVDKSDASVIMAHAHAQMLMPLVAPATDL